jgi:molybdate transport system regulatory protein
MTRPRDALDLSIRLRRGARNVLGPGKLALLAAIDETGSISAAGRKLGMSYRRAWLLVEAMNESFAQPLVAASHGGAHGGGAALTGQGRAVLEGFRAIERKARAATRAEQRAIERLMRRGE